MNIRQSAIKVSIFIVGVIALASLRPTSAAAQGMHVHGRTAQMSAAASDSKAGALVKVVREATERFQDVGLPTFSTLHVGAWKDNPTGTFVNWHANVSCNAFSGK